MKSAHHRALALLLLLGTAAFAGQDPATKAVSPDGMFVFKFRKDNPEAPFGVFSKKSGKSVLAPPEIAVNSFTDQLTWLWSPDSKRIALNIRAGGRYNTASVFAWDGKTFSEWPDFETMLTEKLDAEKESDRRKQGIPSDAYQRRIWDSFKVRRWFDNNTLEVDAYSIRSVTTGDDQTDITGSLRFRLQRQKDGTWKITQQDRVPLEELTKDQAD